MRFGLRTLLIVVALSAVLIPRAITTYRDATYPSLHTCVTGTPTVFEGPYVHCMAAHDPDWGRVRLVFLQQIHTEEQWHERNFIPWLNHRGDSRRGTRLYVNDRLVVPDESVLVYYSHGSATPSFVEFDLDEIPLRDPWWPDAEQLWQKIHDSTRTHLDHGEP